ncbi:MAG: TetR/AcrR family transcriptional regulator [Myxococcales bacterium]|nr:TetR/AcrR family transcriptional regulator [Myxococcales bacterium]
MSVSQENPDAATQPPRASAAARSRQATRARLLESGRLLFAKHGLHGVTTHDIAHRAEVASGTFYLHFKNKREVFREIVDGSVSELIERMDNAALPYLDDLKRTLDMQGFVTAQAEAMVGFAEENREMIRILFSADTDAAAVGSDVLSLLASTVAEGRRELMAAGVVPSDVDAAVLGQAVVGMWAQVLSWWSEDPTRVSRNVLIESLTRIQLSGTHPI